MAYLLKFLSLNVKILHPPVEFDFLQKKEELKEDQEWPTNPWANVDLTIKDTYFITDDERMLICGQKTPQNAPVVPFSPSIQFRYCRI